MPSKLRMYIFAAMLVTYEFTTYVTNDMIMPGMSGREVFQVLKQFKEDSKIILSSGYSADIYTDISKLLKSGAKAFIQKPVSP
ncbi:MAG: response regulator, partial [Burkholderiales bacterium]